MWQMRTLTVLVACCAGGLLPACTGPGHPPEGADREPFPQPIRVTPGDTFSVVLAENPSSGLVTRSPSSWPRTPPADSAG